MARQVFSPVGAYVGILSSVEAVGEYVGQELKSKNCACSMLDMDMELSSSARRTFSFMDWRDMLLPICFLRRRLVDVVAS